MLVTHVLKTQKFLLVTEEMLLLHNFASPLVGREKKVNIALSGHKKSKHQMSAIFCFVFVAIRKEKRQGCLFSFQIVTATKNFGCHLVFGIGFLVIG